MPDLPAAEQELADLLVSRGLVTPSAMDGCLEELRRRLDNRTFPSPRLIDLAIEKGLLQGISGPTLVLPSGPDATCRPSSGAGDAPIQLPSALEDKYSVSGVIGQGGMGTVLDAKDLQIRREVAIKVLIDGDNAPPEQILRFVQEAQIQGRLEHPNICPVHELGKDREGRPFFTMKKVKGTTLESLLHSDKGTSRARTKESSFHSLLEVFTKICDAIAFAHSRGIIHRDLKPSNIMIGEFGEVLVMDWGLAKVMGAAEPAGPGGLSPDRPGSGMDFSVEGNILGTPAYMSPEQAAGKTGEIDVRTDIYALGGILYAILTGKPPVEGKSAQEILLKVSGHRIVPPSLRAPGRKIPGDLEAAAMKALAGRREDRYSSALDLRSDIRAFLEGRTLAAAAYSPWQVAAKWARRNRVFAITASAAAAMILAVLVLYFRDISRARWRAESEAARARAAEIESNAARRVAELRLAEGLLSQGEALEKSRNMIDARDRYREAAARLAALGEPVFPADLGTLGVLSYAPLPLNVLEGHAGPATAVAMGPDGKTAVSAGRDGTLRVWDLPVGRELRTLRGHEGMILALALSPDGRRALTGGSDRTLIHWNLETGEPLRRFRGPRDSVLSVALAPDGRHALSGCDWGNPEALLWDLETGSVARTFDGLDRSVRTVAFSPDGRKFALGGWSRRVSALRVIETDSGREAEGFAGVPSGIHVLEYTRDGDMIFVGSMAEGAKILDAGTGKTLHALPNATPRVISGTFLADGQCLLTGGVDGVLRLLEFKSGREYVHCGPHGGTVTGIRASPDGLMAVSSSNDSRIRLWGLKSRQDLRVFHRGEPIEGVLALSGDGRLALTRGARKLALWDTATGRPLHEFSTGVLPTAAAFSPDGRRLLIGMLDGKVELLDMPPDLDQLGIRGAALPAPSRFSASDQTIRAVAFSPDGRRYLSGGHDKTLAVRETDGGRELWSSVHPTWIFDAAFSPDGQHVLSASWNQSFVLWDASTGKEVRRFDGHTSQVTAVGFSADGKRILSGGMDNMVRLWDAATGREIRGLEGHTDQILKVAFLPDGRWGISCCPNSLRVWDLERGRIARVFSGAGAFAAAPDGSYILASWPSYGAVLMDLGRLPRYRELEPRLSKARETLKGDPGHAESLHALGEWYAFRGAWGWGADFLERARSGGAAVPSLLLARCHWMKEDVKSAIREFERARRDGEAPAPYLDWVLQTLRKS
jgi:WD40 repeat protein/serine/threonine protein kinase